MVFDEQTVRTALTNSWSLNTAVQWTKENPASGQCNVTAAVICDLFGGDVLRTRIGETWHYYNGIDGIRVDLTDSQFTAPGALYPAPDNYLDEASSAEEAMQGIPQHEYDTLKKALLQNLHKRLPD